MRVRLLVLLTVVILPAFAGAQFEFPGFRKPVKKFADVGEVKLEVVPAKAKAGQAVTVKFTIVPYRGCKTFPTKPRDPEQVYRNKLLPSNGVLVHAPVVDPKGTVAGADPTRDGAKIQAYDQSVTWEIRAWVARGAKPGRVTLPEWSKFAPQICNQQNCFAARWENLPAISFEVLPGEPIEMPADELAIYLASVKRDGEKVPKNTEIAGPVYHDDDAITDQLTDKLSALAKAEKCLPPKKLRGLVGKDRVGTVTPGKSDGKPRSAEEVYRKALPSVFLIGSVIADVKAKTGYDTGRLATAWVLAADGVLVTNWHVFDKIHDGEFYGVMDHTGKAYPLTDILAVDRTRDVVVLKVDATGLTPLPVAARPPAVGAWTGVLGHPGDRHFTFTQGTVSRFNLYHDPDSKKASKWMAITAEYAYGSSGSPVLDRTGAVVGMAALTESIDYPLDDEPAQNASRKRMVRRPAQKPKDDKPKPKEPAPPAGGSVLQMVVKLAVPVTELRAVVMGGKE